MEKRDLKQYKSICFKIAELKLGIEADKVSFKVNGSDTTFPYTQHNMNISGICCDYKDLIKIHKLERRKKAIEDFIDNVPDARVSNILRLKYIDNLSWVQVSYKVFGRYDKGETARKAINRHFEKNIKNF